MLKLLRAIVARDLRLALRRRADIVSALFFFIIVVSLFPLGVGPEPEQLPDTYPNIWILSAYVSPPSRTLCF